MKFIRLTISHNGRTLYVNPALISWLMPVVVGDGKYITQIGVGDGQEELAIVTETVEQILELARANEILNETSPASGETVPAGCR